MQTKPKQKLTAILIAFTMILTTMIQLCIPITVHAEETNREIDFNYSANGTYIYQSQNHEKEYIFNCHVVGSGNFVIKSYRIDTENAYGIDYQMLSYIVSNKPFQYYCSGTNQNGGGSDNLLKPYTYNGYYFVEQQFQFTSKKNAPYTDITLNGYFGSIKDVDSYIYSPQFGNLKEDIDNGNIDLSKDDYEEKTFDEDSATFDDSIPSPKMSVDNKLNYRFLNDDASYYYQIKGRWRSIDNVTINKGTFKHTLYYKTTVQCDLLHWIAPIELRSTSDVSSFAEIGKDYFYNFLTMYPIEKRNIHFPDDEKYDYGKEWYELGGNENWVNNFKDMLSSVNSVEIYVRYFKENDDGSYSYGKWTHYYNNLTPSGSQDRGYRDGIGELTTEHFQSEVGLTPDEFNELESLPDSRVDTDIVGSESLYDDEENKFDFSQITKTVLSLYEQAKTIFSMYSTVFSFLPQWVTDIISVSVTLVCFIGIWKVIR